SLDPERLQSSDFADLSGKKTSQLYAQLKDGLLVKGMIRYDRTRSRAPFPSKTRGFLYYHRHPFLPLTTGEIRFRVTESSDPTCFQNGADLTRSDGALPWSLPVIRLQDCHAPIIRLLEPDIPEAISNLNILFQKICLTFLEQPFVMRLDATCTITTVDSQLHVRKSHMPVLLPVPEHKLRSTFKGRLLVRFEQAPLSEHENDTSIVMRVLKVLEPPEPLVAYAHLFQPIPEPGTLLKYKSFRQIRNHTFNHQFLTRLPRITGSTPTLDGEPLYVGRIVLRFERSTLPQHKNGNFAVLRVLKILDAIKPVNPRATVHLPVPLVGELLVSISGRARSFNLDKAKFMQGLRALPSLPDDEPDL
ncbi:hypothetical protein C0993_006956, partial [Termitomyces sp. T159_Od127]